MCTGAEAAMLAASTASVAANQYNQNQTHRDQMRAAEERRRLGEEANRKAGARVSEEVERVKTSTPDGEERTLQNEFMEALRRSQVDGSAGSEPVGAVSDRFAADSAAATRANSRGNVTAARSQAAIDAPFMARVREATGQSRLVSDLSRVENQHQGQDFLAQLRQSLISPNAGIQAGADLMSGYAQAYAGRARPNWNGATGVVAPGNVRRVGGGR